jgi:hypothetical protein
MFRMGPSPLQKSSHLGPQTRRVCKNGGKRHLRKSRLIFDTGPIFLYFAEDKQVKEMFDEVKIGRAEGYTCEVNIAEFYYKTCEKFGEKLRK